MNKTELITYLRNPNKLSKEQLGKLEEVVNAHPYFLSARLLLAKVSKEQNHPETKKRVASAAIYSTDRVLLKKYLSGNLFFLAEPAQIEETPAKESAKEQVKIPVEPKKEENKSSTGDKRASDTTPSSKQTAGTSERPAPSVKKESKDVTTSKTLTEEERPVRKESEKTAQPTRKSVEIAPPKKPVEKEKAPVALKSKDSKPQPEVPDLPTGELDSILEDLQRDMENLKNSRAKFAEVQQKIEEDDAVSAAINKAAHKDDSPIVKEESSKSSISEESTNISDQKEKDSDTTPEKVADTIDQKETVTAGSDESSETPKKEETQVGAPVEEDSKKAISDITQQGLEAAKKAKQEVVEEERTKESSKEVKKEDAVAKKEDTKEEKKDTPKGDERAERVIREPRFSRFSSRSYLKPLEDIDPASFLDDKEEKSESKAKEEPKKDSESKITLPDLSKAKPVARKNPRKSKKSLKSSLVDTDSIDDLASDKKKKAEEKPTEKVESKKKPEKEVAEIPKKEKVASKKKTTTKKTTEKKTSKAKASESKVAGKKKTATKKETSKKTPKEKSTAKSTKKTDKKDDDKSDGKSQQDIIDKFIKEAPSIKYQRKEDVKTEDLAEQSAVWDPNLASEYLAEIYLHQGNKKRAIEIYEALSLKYPEKKSYFADLISKIE